MMGLGKCISPFNSGHFWYLFKDYGVYQQSKVVTVDGSNPKQPPGMYKTI